MSEPAQPKPSCCNVRSLVKLVLALSVLVALGAIALKALQQPALCFLQIKAVLPNIGTTHARVIALLVLLLLIATQILVHKADRRKGKSAGADTTGLGIIGRFEWRRRQGSDQLLAKQDESATDSFKALKKQVDAAFHETDKSSVRAFMTKQSIFAALTLFLLKAVSSNLPAGLPDTGTEALYVVSAAGFLATLLTVLVAIQIYSTYVRIQWDETGGNRLLKKGREMDEWSFYSLTISILVALCAYQPWAALVAIPGFGILMYRYYFFD